MELIPSQASTLSLQSNAGSGNTSKQPVPGYPLEQKPTVEVVIAENFDRVKGDIQVQFIEVSIHIPMLWEVSLTAIIVDEIQTIGHRKLHHQCAQELPLHSRGGTQIIGS